MGLRGIDFKLNCGFTGALLSRLNFSEVNLSYLLGRTLVNVRPLKFVLLVAITSFATSKQ